MGAVDEQPALLHGLAQGGGQLRALLRSAFQHVVRHGLGHVDEVQLALGGVGEALVGVPLGQGHHVGGPHLRAVGE